MISIAILSMISRLKKMGKNFNGFPKCLIAGLNRARCLMRKIIIHLKIKELFEEAFPADFIAEGLDQTRGWFYTLTVLSAALFDKACV